MCLALICYLSHLRSVLLGEDVHFAVAVGDQKKGTAQRKL